MIPASSRSQGVTAGRGHRRGVDAHSVKRLYYRQTVGPDVGRIAGSRVGGGASNVPDAGHRPPPKLHVQISRMQLSRRLSTAKMQVKVLSRANEQARTRRTARPGVVVANPYCATAGTDATRCVAVSSRRDVGRACGLERVCNTRPSRAEED